MRSKTSSNIGYTSVVVVLTAAIVSLIIYVTIKALGNNASLEPVEEVDVEVDAEVDAESGDENTPTIEYRYIPTYYYPQSLYPRRYYSRRGRRHYRHRP